MSPLTAVQTVTVPFKPQWQCLLACFVARALLVASWLAHGRVQLALLHKSLEQRGGSLTECLFSSSLKKFGFWGLLMQAMELLELSTYIYSNIYYSKQARRKGLCSALAGFGNTHVRWTEPPGCCQSPDSQRWSIWCFSVWQWERRWACSILRFWLSSIITAFPCSDNDILTCC